MKNWTKITLLTFAMVLICGALSAFVAEPDVDKIEASFASEGQVNQYGGCPGINGACGNYEFE